MMEKDKTQLMRTSIYTGGTSPVKMIQAGFYRGDCIVYDLVRFVSAMEKDSATFLDFSFDQPYRDPKERYVIVRVNGIYSKEN